MVLAAVAVAIWPRSRAIAAGRGASARSPTRPCSWPTAATGRATSLGAWVLGGLCGFVVPRVAERLCARREAAPAGE